MKSRSNGFTLIEVLIGMTLLSIMVVLLFTSLKICADSWEKGESKITNVNEMAVVYNFFQQHLSVARPLWNDGGTEEKTFSFQANSHTLHFVSAFPASAGRMGLQLFSVIFDDASEDADINVSLMPFGTGLENDESAIEEVTLIKHVKAFNIAYFGADDSASEGVWVEDWVGKSTLPRLVKIKIELTNGIYWPEIIVDLKVTVPPVDSANNNAPGVGL